MTAALALVASAAVAQERTNAPKFRDAPYVLMISFDGFRADYLSRIDLPNFARVTSRGVRSAGMIPVFPSKTFPNHYSLVTGMYSETHGLVGNRFIDPQRNAAYSMGDTVAVLDGTWYRGEPIWSTAEKQDMLAASFFWVASEAVIAGARPTYYKKYDGRIRNDQRVDSVLMWLGLPADRRPHMVTMYFSTVDNAGHDDGPLSLRVDSAAKQLDATLGRLLDGLERLPEVKDKLTLILVADHGMSETHPRWYAGLDTLTDTTGVQLAEGGTLANLHVRGGIARARVLSDSINRRMKFGRAYVRGEVPAHLRYNSDPRIGDIVVVMNDHWQVGWTNRPAREGGNHGWDPTFPNMHALFVASGPGIPAGRTIPTFENVDVYPFIAEVLGLKPAKGIDGKKGRLAKLIRSGR